MESDVLYSVDICSEEKTEDYKSEFNDNIKHVTMGE